MRYVDAFPLDVEGQRLVYLKDPEGLTRHGLAVPPHVFQLMTLLDGEHTVAEARDAFAERYGYQGVTEAQVEQLVLQLDEALLLDSARFREHRATVEAAFRSELVRPAAHAGNSYPDDADELRSLIDGFFRPPAGPGAPPRQHDGRQLKGLIAPHIDFSRGGPCFAWAYREMAASRPPETCVVLGTGHAARSTYVLCDKAFDTPFGVVPADSDFIASLSDAVDGDLFSDIDVHRAEHSIEFQAVFLKYLFPDTDVSIVPILCGSFHEQIAARQSPMASAEVAGFTAALRGAIRERGDRVCVVTGVDLSHVGPRFGDSDRLTETFIEQVMAHDRQVLAAAADLDAEAVFRTIWEAGDRTRICGTSSIYTMLNVMQAERAEVLRHDRVVDDAGQSMVSFASVAYY